MNADGNKGFCSDGSLRPLVTALTDTPSTQHFDPEPVLKIEPHSEKTWHMSIKLDEY